MGCCCSARQTGAGVGRTAGAGVAGAGEVGAGVAGAGAGESGAGHSMLLTRE